ncbi:M23 family metallopeptidase [Stackebrandtia soli]|uniref:M23 family metallopeptidase n=1 Tax=Stackebrandtia soli TaxID=1892856 RepID=UPI0039E9175C
MSHIHATGGHNPTDPHAAATPDTTPPRHTAPRRHRGRHRAPLIAAVDPRRRYVVVVGAALAAAGTVALASAAAMPSVTDSASALTVIDADGDPAAPMLPSTADRADRTGGRAASPITAQSAERVWRAPLANFDLSSLFGARWGTWHKGLDFAAPEGAPVLAVYPGTVVEAGWNSGGFGQLVVIDHGDGVTTLYAHNSAIAVSVGQTVRAGEHIADVGNTGNSFGPHSHFEIHHNGQAVDPLRFMADRGVDIRHLAGAVLTEDGPRH